MIFCNNYLYFVKIAKATKCNIVNCFVDPCQIEKIKGCANYPKAKCISNYCGGCNFDWKYKGNIVDCNAAPPCIKYNCFVEPCLVTKCPARPKAVCKNNYCGGCFADFYVNNTRVNC